MFSKILKKLRNEHGLSQDELASILGYSRTAISAYEIGRNEPSFDDLKKIAVYFDVSIDYLLGKADIKKTSSDKSEDVMPERLKKTMELYSRLPPELQAEAERHLDYLIARQEKEAKKDID